MGVDQLVFIGASTHQAQTQQRCPGQIETTRALFVRQLLQRFNKIGPRLPVKYLDRQA